MKLELPCLGMVQLLTHNYLCPAILNTLIMYQMWHFYQRFYQPTLMELFWQIDNGFIRGGSGSSTDFFEWLLAFQLRFQPISFLSDRITVRNSSHVSALEQYLNGLGSFGDL